MSKVLDQVKGKSLIIKMDLKIIDKDEQKIGLILEELASINVITLGNTGYTGLCPEYLGSFLP